jgi:hypothetical protein
MTDFLSQLVRRRQTEPSSAGGFNKEEPPTEAAVAEVRRQQELRAREQAEAVAREKKHQQELREREEAEAAAAEAKRQQELRERQRLIYFATAVLLCLTSVGAFLHWGTLGPRDIPPLSSVERRPNRQCHRRRSPQLLRLQNQLSHARRQRRDLTPL